MAVPTHSDATSTDDWRQPVYAVVGMPDVAANSLSPAMFAAAFAAAGMRAWYVPLAVREQSAAKALRSLPRLGFRGANVTMPFKHLAADVAHTRSRIVEQVGVANVLSIDQAGRMHADATDGDAVVEALRTRGVALEGSTVTVLGAGGAAAESAFALAEAGARRMLLWNRTTERATSLARRLQAGFPALGLEVPAQVPIEQPAHVLVSAVPKEALAPDTLASLHADTVVVDLAYRRDRQPTPLIVAASDRSASCIDGREILARQGAASFRIWFGTDAPTEVMARAVR